MPETAVEQEPQRAAARRRSWRALPRPAPFELVSYAGLAVTLLFSSWHGLHFGWRSIAYVLWNVRYSIPLLFALGVVTQAVAHRLRGRSVRDYLRRVASKEWLALWLRLWLAVVAFVYSLMFLKISVPLVRTVLFDRELWRLDRLLHFGVSPSIRAIELTAGTPLAALFDGWYALWVPSIPFALAYATAHVESDRRRNFLLANSVLWLAGAWIYLAVPALGPCYATPEILDPIRAEIPYAAETQKLLFAQYGKLLASRGGFLASFSPTLGVAAMPSLHVAAHWLLALWAKRYERRLFLPLALATALTFFGSLVTGWHYAVDGYAGLLLAWLAVALADRWQPAVREAVEPGAPANAGGAAAVAGDGAR